MPSDEQTNPCLLLLVLSTSHKPSKKLVNHALNAFCVAPFAWQSFRFFAFLLPITNIRYGQRSTAFSTVEQQRYSISVTETNHGSDRDHGQFFLSNNKGHSPEIVLNSALQLHMNIFSCHWIINNSRRFSQGWTQNIHKPILRLALF